MSEGQHVIRVRIQSGYVDLRAECYSAPDAECRVNLEEGIIASSVCRYIQWWAEAEVDLAEFYNGDENVVLRDGAEISIDWDGEVWVWELKNG